MKVDRQKVWDNMPQPPSTKLDSKLRTPNKTYQNVFQKKQTKVLKAPIPTESCPEDPRPAETMPGTTIFPIQKRKPADKKKKVTEKEGKKKEEQELKKLATRKDTCRQASRYLMEL